MRSLSSPVSQLTTDNGQLTIRRWTMDCRRSLVALGLAWVCCGCMGTQPQQQRPTSMAPEAPPPHLVQRDADGPKRAPKASTMVAFAAVKESEASKADLAPNIQRNFRDDARKAYQEALQIDPACVAAYFGLGRVYRDLGDFDRALDTYHKGLEKHPREVGLWVDMGMCHARRKD